MAVTYPTPTFGYFRMSWTDPVSGRRRQTSAGRHLDAALLRAEDIERRLSSAHSAATTATRISDLLEAYMDPKRVRTRRKDGAARPWSDGYRSAIAKRTAKIDSRIGSLSLASLTQARVAAVVNEENTYNQAEQMRSTFSAIVGFGVDKGFLRGDQANVAKIDVTVAPGARARGLDRTPLEGEHHDLVNDDDIPSLEAYTAFRRGLDGHPHGYRHFSGLAETLAFCGPRIHEAFALDAGDVLPACGSFVFPRLSVRRQVVELAGGGRALRPPKNGNGRQVSIIETTPTGFPLARWLVDRAVEARVEQEAGTNPHALLFPSPRGDYWWLRNFRRSVFTPAAEAAGWPYTSITTTSSWRVGDKLITRETRQKLWRHTVHSSRHLFATTAINDWGWRDDVLCMAGGWSSELFVRQHYYARTPAVLMTGQQGQIEAVQRYKDLAEQGAALRATPDQAPGQVS